MWRGWVENLLRPVAPLQQAAPQQAAAPSQAAGTGRKPAALDRVGPPRPASKATTEGESRALLTNPVVLPFPFVAVEI
jgi:hypothetical protein